jgi:BirA family biotin operon repressor/biotin-[acetyl-CoA-carboxylase] ligase
MSDLPALTQQLRLALTTAHLGRTCRVLETTGSTQDDARQWAVAGAPHGALVWAMAQTAGRGRLERPWDSGPGRGLWFSVVLRPRLLPVEAGLITLAAGVGIQQGLEEAGATGVQLKWPNDLKFRGRKLGGILADAVVAGGELRHVVLGVGLNLAPPEDPSLERLAASLRDLLPQVEPAVLLARVLGGLEGSLKGLEAEGFAPARAAWLRVSETIGREVRALTMSGPVMGTAVDLDEDGSLVIRQQDGQMARVTSGEVQNLR